MSEAATQRPAARPLSPAQLLARLRTVDGEGSNLDADTLRGEAPEQLGAAASPAALSTDDALKLLIQNLLTAGLGDVLDPRLHLHASE